MIAMNPVLRRELLERWRGRRAVTALTVYLTLLAGALYGLYRLGVMIIAQPFGGVDASIAGPTLGRFLLESVLFLTLVGVLFVVPAYAAAQLAGERERRTLPLLQATLLRSWEIVGGKLAASIAWMALLVVATAPLAAATLFLGGVTPTDVLAGVGSVLVTMVGVGGLALGVSALTRRTVAAVVLTYGVVLLLVGGTGVAAVTSAILQTSDGTTPTRPPIALYANPFFGLADAASAVNAAEAIETLPSPLSMVAVTLPDSSIYQPDEFAQGFDGDVGGDLGGPLGGPLGPAAPLDTGPPPALMVGAVHLVLGAAGFAVATWRLRSAAVRPTRGRAHRGRGRRTDVDSQAAS